MRKTVLLIMIGSVLMSLALFMLADKQAPHIYHGIEVSPSVIRRGGAITITFHVTRFRECPGVVHRTITYSNGEPHIYDAVPAALGGQVSYSPTPRPRSYPGDARIVREFVIPVDAVLGRARYQSVIYYYCNFVQQAMNWPIVVNAPVAYFDIVE